MNPKAMDDNKNLKKNRIKMYFLDAAKEIIINEGHENVSVRKVADMAGYSYPTMYNYFDDLNGLLWDVKEAMIRDLIELMSKKMMKTTYDINGIKKLFRIYVGYYFENPNVFKFFYFHQLNSVYKKIDEAESEINFAQMWQETFKGFVLAGKLQETEIEAVAKLLIYGVHGMLTLCFS
ncbi:MAG: TetR/AcrR family transcriptional regulator, partial [Bacillota bacterium]|nr:TetR/AcrR family transcriptional regulator [Bacillota bacterium]